MDKPFSEMVEDELFDTKCSFKTLSKIANELNDLLNENAYLMAENKELKKRIKMYQDSTDKGIKEGQANIAMALRACLNKDE